MGDKGYFQIERVEVDAFYSVKSQRGFEIGYVLGGEGELSLSGARHDLAKGCLYFATPFDIIRMTAADRRPLDLYRCRFDWHFSTCLGGFAAPQRSAIDYVFELSPFVRFSDEEQVVAQRHCDQMAEESARGDVWGRLATMSSLLSLSGLHQRAARRMDGGKARL